MLWPALISATPQKQRDHDGHKCAYCRDRDRGHNEIRIVDEEFHRSTSTFANGPDQWLAANRLSLPPGFIASPLHRVVRCSLF